jgi:hypothetical protein
MHEGTSYDTLSFQCVAMISKQWINVRIYYDLYFEGNKTIQYNKTSKFNKNVDIKFSARAAVLE